MARPHEMMYEDNVESFQIPEDANTFEGFWRWLESDGFPESGRIDFLGGEIAADMSPEDLYTHGALKVEIVAVLVELVKRSGLGDLQSDRSRFRSPFARVTTEPDIVAVFRESIESGRARLVPSTRRKGQNRIVAFEGAVDLIVEIVSDSSVGKDLDRLPPYYARAGVRELWLLDARGTEVRFDLLVLQEGVYSIVPPDADGWLRSPCLGRAFRLQRFHQPPFPWSYRLEHKSPG
ncbi:MAG TPA: Uma2 family endonuclease [Thermoanaerobaculia bacterium]|jgi:Uma2 family endonuclease|nr:Uma2 family endonuclease [Thermoanaerobaculia bacterium]